MSSKIDLSENVVADVPGTPASGKLSVYAKDDGNLYAKNDAGTETNLTSGGGGGAPVDATYITQTANGTLTNEQALASLATGVLKNTTATGVLSIATGTDLPTVPVTNGGTGLTTVTTGGVLIGNGASNLNIATGTTTDDILAWDGSAFASTQPVIRLIASTTLGVATASISLTSIPATYSSLRLVMFLRSVRVATTDTVLVQFNLDTTAANYFGQEAGGNGASVFAAVNNGATATVLGLSVVPAASSPSASFGAVTVDIPDYANATRLKTATGKSASRITTGTSGNIVYLTGGTWNNSNAITSIQIKCLSANLDAGSSVFLYGLN